MIPPCRVAEMTPANRRGRMTPPVAPRPVAFGGMTASVTVPTPAMVTACAQAERTLTETDPTPAMVTAVV
jgi:hypothetical protein